MKQLDKFPKIKEFLPNVKAAVQYTGTPTQEGILSWQELLELGKKESDDEINDRLNQIAINQCCILVYTSGTTGPPKGINESFSIKIFIYFLNTGIISIFIFTIFSPNLFSRSNDVP